MLASEIDHNMDNFVSIIMPSLNEEHFIEAAVNSVIPNVAGLDYEILIIDGGSVDGTLRIVERLSSENPRIRLLHNPKRLQAAALNIGAAQADTRSNVLVRADCHALYSSDFAVRCITALRESGAASVVVPMRTVGQNCIQSAIAAAQNSPVGNGASPHRLKTQSGYVPHGHHAAFDRTVFLQQGGYNETMECNEDAEYDYRLTRAGHKIWMEADAPVTYYPRKSFSRLAVQYFRHGKGRAMTQFIHGSSLLPRQMAPVALLFATLAAVVLSPISIIFAFPTALYLIIIGIFALKRSIESKQACALLIAPAAFIMHHGWALGFVYNFASLRIARAKHRALSAEKANPLG